jgi:hypothetical protein
MNTRIHGARKVIIENVGRGDFYLGGLSWRRSAALSGVLCGVEEWI